MTDPQSSPLLTFNIFHSQYDILHFNVKKIYFNFKHKEIYVRTDFLTSNFN